MKPSIDSSKFSKTFSVVIPVYNQVHLTRRCLDSILLHSSLVREIIIVDNGSKDETPQVIQGFADARVRIIRNDENKGFGRAVNQGLRVATGDFLVVLNNDTWVMKGWDLALAEASIRHGIDVIGPYFYERGFSENMDETAARFVARNRGRLRHHFVPILMCFSRHAYEVLRFDHGGLFDERFFVTYEDTDLLERMSAAKIAYGQTGSCFIWHHSKGTRGTVSTYEQEGLKLFVEKWGFDPRPREHTWWARLRRRWWKIKEKFGLF